MSELLPCPFCGGDASIKRSYDDDMTLWIKVECNKCGATTRGNWCREDCPLFYQERRDEWNTRTPQWQPIETAPRDGRPFLAKRHGNTIKIYWWNNIANSFRHDAGCDAQTPHWWMPLPPPREQS